MAFPSLRGEAGEGERVLGGRPGGQREDMRTGLMWLVGPQGDMSLNLMCRDPDVHI